MVMVVSGNKRISLDREVTGRSHSDIRLDRAMRRQEVGDEFVAVYLRPSFQHELGKALGAQHLVSADSWQQLRHILKTHPISLVLVDPLVSNSLETDCIADLLRSFPTTPIRAYVSLTVAEFKAVTYLARIGLDDVILHGSDDLLPHFASTLACYRSIPFVAEILASLKPQLERVPIRVEKTLRDVFQRPHRYGNARDICRDAGVTIAALYRCCEDAKLGTPKKMIIAAKVLHGWAYLLDPGASVCSVAKKLGYADARGFAEHIGQVFLKSPSSMRSDEAPARIVPHLQRWLRQDGRTSRATNAKRATGETRRIRRKA
jgi:AraC-like DNA-binding protein